MPNGVTTNSTPGGDLPGAPGGTRLAILPLLILPLELSSDQASAASLVGEVISHLRTNLTVLPPLVPTSSYGNNSASLGPHGPAIPLNSLPYGIGSGELNTSRNAPLNMYRMTENNAEVGPTFVPLVDVGTTTMRLSHAHTQTEVNVPPDCTVPVPAAQQTEYVGIFYQHQQQAMRDSYAATSPPECQLIGGTGTSQMSVGSSPPPTNCEWSIKVD